MELVLAFEASISLLPIKDLGMTPIGHRRIIDISSGTVSGPKLQGKILPGGADWQYIREDNVTYLDARYTIEAADGALIYVSNQGYRHGPDEVIEKLKRGEPVEDNSYYFNKERLSLYNFIKRNYANISINHSTDWSNKIKSLLKD